MANDEHLEKLKKGVEAWNNWRKKNPSIFPDLSGADLAGINLREMNFRGADLRSMNLMEADLTGVNMRYAIIDQTKVSCVRYSRGTRCLNIDAEGLTAGPVFKRFVLDQQYLADFKASHRVMYYVWLVFADCGRSLLRWAMWSVVLAVMFAVIFYSLGPEAIEIKNLPYNFWSTLYYSVVTFTTLGFGDVVPKTNEAAWWVMAEVITGYIMLGGLISILANKLARRS